MITKVTYARLFNLGNYENERLEVEVTIQDSSDIALEGAWEEARSAVEGQHIRFGAARKEEAERERREYAAQIARERAEREAARQKLTDDNPPF